MRPLRALPLLLLLLHLLRAKQYCFSGDQKLQDQSQIAQDIATLYAAIPDHTAVRGVSDKGRAQFTDFKYEKTEVSASLLTLFWSDLLGSVGFWSDMGYWNLLCIRPEV